jgi:hypothetical protein
LVVADGVVTVVADADAFTVFENDKAADAAGVFAAIAA